MEEGPDWEGRADGFSQAATHCGPTGVRWLAVSLTVVGEGRRAAGLT